MRRQGLDEVMRISLKLWILAVIGKLVVSSGSVERYASIMHDE
jgi:hypothetical protein